MSDGPLLNTVILLLSANILCGLHCLQPSCAAFTVSRRLANIRPLSCVLHLRKQSRGELSACRGTTKETRGTAYVVYEDIYDAKAAVEHLSGFNVANRYLICLFYGASKRSKKVRPGSML